MSLPKTITKEVKTTQSHACGKETVFLLEFINMYMFSLFILYDIDRLNGRNF